MGAGIVDKGESPTGPLFPSLNDWPDGLMLDGQVMKIPHFQGARPGAGAGSKALGLRPHKPSDSGSKNMDGLGVVPRGKYRFQLPTAGTRYCSWCISRGQERSRFCRDIPIAAMDASCWICFGDEDTPEEPLYFACKCPHQVHRRCLARWQLFSAGKR